MKKRILTFLFWGYLCIGNILTVSAEEVDTEQEEMTSQAPVIEMISVPDENVQAPGEVELNVQLSGEGEYALSGVRLVFQAEDEAKRDLYYWLNSEKIIRTDEEGAYICVFELAENVATGTYKLSEIEIYDQADQTRNYALDLDTGLLMNWTGGYEIEPVNLVVAEGCADTDFDAPVLRSLSLDRTVNTGETLEVCIGATDVSGVKRAMVVFYNSHLDQYLFLNSYETNDLGNGNYKFLFKISKYQYEDTYEFESVTLTDNSAYTNSVSYWVDGSHLKNVDGHAIAFSGSNTYLMIANQNDVQWAMMDTNDRYSVISDTKDNGTVAVIGGDSQGSQWILDKRPLNAAKVKKLKLILPDLLTETEIIIDAAKLPSDLADETYAGLEMSGFENGCFDLKLQMTNANIPFQMKLKTDELNKLSDKTFSLVKVAADGSHTIVNDGLLVDQNGYLNLSFDSGIDSGDGWSHFQLIRNTNPVCENGHTWGENILEKTATLKVDGQEVRVCEVCKTVERNAISKVSSVVLAYTKFIYNGNIRKPAITLKDAKGKKLVNGTDYTVSYASGRKNVGRYAVKVTLKGKYSGSSTKYFTIVPKAVTNFKAVRYQYGNKIRLSWTKSTGATGYRIYRKKANASSYTYLGATKNAYYINSGLTKNTAYRYKVIPYYKTSSGTTHYYSTNAYKTFLINTVVKGNKLSQVTKVKAAKSGTKVKVSWKNVGYETGYQISRSASKTGTNVVITYKTTSGTSKTVTATKNKAYYYKVRAYRVVNGKKIFGAWSAAVKFTRK